MNAGWRAFPADYLLTINDDAYASPAWLEALIATAESDDKVGMCASRIVLRDSPDKLDSAGLSIYPDGATKQRGRGLPADAYALREEVLLPSGCAALYKREMIDSIGGFDESYFLYGEDAELGLRARLAGWTCLYEPSALVEHDYSMSAGRASVMKAFYVERNPALHGRETVPVASLARGLVPFAAALLASWSSRHAWRRVGRRVGSRPGRLWFGPDGSPRALFGAGAAARGVAQTACRAVRIPGDCCGALASRQRRLRRSDPATPT